MAERAHLSIGEVLSLLREEFPDITISKIRFLESQGLLDPERTPSGYRKFYEEDVERLRWILRQQREHFLPLKVIKGASNSYCHAHFVQHVTRTSGPSLTSKTYNSYTRQRKKARRIFECTVGKMTARSVSIVSCLVSQFY